MTSFLSSLFSIFRGASVADQLAPMGISTTQDAASIQLKNRAGQQIALNENTIIIQDTNGSIITLDASGVHIQSSSNIWLETPKVVVNTSRMVINAEMVKVSGIVQCETLIANTVTGTTYTPGAGNIW